MTELSSVAVILAAGSSRRFGADKRAQLLNDGRTLLSHTLERYLSVFNQVVVVLRPTDQADEGGSLLSGLTNKQNQLIKRYAPLAAAGMGHSLADAADYLSEVDEQLPFVVGLGDMPFIQVATLKRLATELAWRCAEHTEPPPIVQPRLVRPPHPQKPGNPVGFDPRYLPLLQRLKGDAGARALLKQHAHAVHYVDVSDPGVLQDVDTPEDIEPH